MTIKLPQHHEEQLGEILAEIPRTQKQIYLRSIGQTFLAVGKRDPRPKSQNQTNFNLLRMLKAYSKKDPPPKGVKPVPIMVIRAVASNTTDPTTKAIANMIELAFFFLLRPGKYTDSPSDTSPFWFSEVQMWIGM